jgi:hypothetical protein
MRILDPGHLFALANIDYKLAFIDEQALRFVKREGLGYPGNVGYYPGTTLQEVYRACIARHKYLNKQEQHFCNTQNIQYLRSCIIGLEIRAAERHHRPTPEMHGEIENISCCPKCLHIGCEGQCRA